MNKQSDQKIINSTIEVLNKYYSIRCPESELTHLQEAAHFLNSKMLEVQDAGKAISLERIAIISALNVAYQFFEVKRQKEALLTFVQQRVDQLQSKVQAAINKTVQTEFTYIPEEEMEIMV